MRKLLVLIVIGLLVGGCSSSGLSEQERIAKYKEYIHTVQDNNGAQSQEIPFEYSLKVTKSKSNEYMYTVIIDQPHIAMYDIEAIVVDVDKVNSNEMMANLGIIDDQDALYHMIPFQVNTKRGFHKGIQLNGFTEKKQIHLQALVTWKDYSKLNTTKAFFSFHYQVQEDEKNDQSKKPTTGDDAS